ncbi:Uncharacterised protein [Bacillus freudenreichii]|nr:Uncharacterised protein [Bacillus freudenreichii]
MSIRETEEYLKKVTSIFEKLTIQKPNNIKKQLPKKLKSRWKRELSSICSCTQWPNILKTNFFERVVTYSLINPLYGH